MTAVSRRLIVVLLAAMLCAAANAAGKECIVMLDGGVILEWKQPGSGTPQLKINKLEKNSEGERLGYRKGDEILAIGGHAMGEDSLRDFLLRSGDAEKFRVRRKEQELELPALFRVKGVIDGSRKHHLTPGQKLSELHAKTFQGEPVKLEQFTGHVVLLSFWAGWCKPCMQELPNVVELHRNYAARGLVVLAVNLDEDKKTAEKILKSTNSSFVILNDPGMDSRTANSYQISSLPFTLLIDREGFIRLVVIGYSTSSFAKEFQEPIEILLNSAGPFATIVWPF